MRLSRKADYALRVLFTLVDHWGQGPVSLTTLARTNDVPKRYLEHIMLDLKAQGWVESLPGRRGGYVLAQPPERITMGQVIRRLDGAAGTPEPPEGAFRFREVLVQVRDLTEAHLDGATLASVARGEPAGAGHRGHKDFTGGEGI